MEPTPTGSGRGWPRHCRLRSRVYIRALFTRGQSEVVRVDSVLLLFRVVPYSSWVFQAGFAVRRQVRAVERNRVKRIMRETVRLHQALLEPPSGTLTVMAVYRGRLPVDAGQLRNNLKEALRRMHKRMSI